MDDEVPDRPPDREDVDALLSEHAVIPVLYFTAPETDPVKAFVRVIADESGAVRLLLQDGKDINQQIVINRERLLKQVEDPLNE